MRRLFDICVETHSELAAHMSKYKWQVVFGLGNNVRDEFGLAVMFPEQGSGASCAIASKLLDAVSLSFRDAMENSRMLLLHAHKLSSLRVWMKKRASLL